MPIEGVVSLLRIRVINRFDAGNSEVTSDLPHPHQSTWTTIAMQPGNPGSTALGSFTIPLFAPLGEGFLAAKPIYDQLRRYQRVEAYISHDGASLGKLAFAGPITGIRKNYTAYELTGVNDVGYANLTRPFPGEFLSNVVTSSMLKGYLGTNELGWSDTFNPYTAGNYNSTHTLATTSGAWSSTTDDNMTVVTCSTGTGAALISKSGAAAGDSWHTHYVEVTGRLVPSTDAANAGRVGVGMSTSATDLTIASGSILGQVTALYLSGRYSLTATITVSGSGGTNVANALINVDDPQAIIPLTIGLLVTQGGNATGTQTASLIVNGKVVIGQLGPQSFVPSTSTVYPYIMFGTPSSGSAACYLTNLVQMTRFTTDGLSTAAAFGNGTINVATHSLPFGVDPGPSFLETWTRLATREGWYWRYTPKPYVIGTRTLGMVDFAADPGTDLTTKVIFSRAAGNLAGLEFNNNGDPLAADTAISGQSTLDGGGISYWRDVATLGKYGVIQDEALSFTHSDFNSLRRASFQISQNKIALDTLGAKTVVVIRDPQFADTYRELDKITIHDPEMGCNMLACRIMARTFKEGDPTETLVLDQFSEDFKG